MKVPSRRHVLACALAVAVACGLAAATSPGIAAQGSTPIDSYRVINVYPHDTNAYTQGLIYRDGFLYESTGLRGSSTLRKVKLETGEVVQQRRIDQAHFAEGLSDWKGQLVQLTWQSNVAFVYDMVSFAPRRTFSYTGEGWGLTRDDTRFILSDGTSQLRFLDPETFRELGRVTVTDGKTPHRRSQRARIRARRGVCERVAHGSNRPDIASNRTGHRLDRSARPDVVGLSARSRGRTERHRTRRGTQSPVCHRQVVAEALRDRSHSASATVSARTSLAPAPLRARAHPSSVAPVVRTSSTSTTI